MLLETPNSIQVLSVDAEAPKSNLSSHYAAKECQNSHVGNINVLEAPKEKQPRLSASKLNNHSKKGIQIRLDYFKYVAFKYAGTGNSGVMLLAANRSMLIKHDCPEK